MPFGLKDVGGLNSPPLRPICSSSKNPLCAACGELRAHMEGWRAPDELCRSDTSAGSAPACSMPSSKLNGAQREFTPQRLTGCQLQQSCSHWESFGTRCCCTASWGGSTLDNLHGCYPHGTTSPLGWVKIRGHKNHHNIHLWKMLKMPTSEGWRKNVWFESPTFVRSSSSVVTQYLRSCEQLNYEASLARIVESWKKLMRRERIQTGALWQWDMDDNFLHIVLGRSLSHCPLGLQVNKHNLLWQQRHQAWCLKAADCEVLRRLGWIKECGNSPCFFLQTATWWLAVLLKWGVANYISVIANS